MAKFLVLYNSTVSSEELMAGSTPEQMQSGMDAWMKWSDKCGSAIIELGTPLGNGKRVTQGGVSGTDTQVSGYSVMQGETIDDVTALLAGHPHFMTPGEPTIDVLEYMLIPGM